MSELIIPLAAVATFALILAAAEWIDARRARRQAYDALRAATAARHPQPEPTRASVADLIDALNAMQCSAATYRGLYERAHAEKLAADHAAQEARADADRYAMAAQELHERAQEAERQAAASDMRYLGAIQTQLHAGMTMVIDHAGWRAPN